MPKSCHDHVLPCVQGTGGGLFSSSSTAGAGGGGLFGSQAPSSSGAGFGTSSSGAGFGSPGFGQAAGLGSGTGGGGMFSGLGGKPSEEKANTNVFGSATFGNNPASSTAGGGLVLITQTFAHQYWSIVPCKGKLRVGKLEPVCRLLAVGCLHNLLLQVCSAHLLLIFFAI